MIRGLLLGVLMAMGVPCATAQDLAKGWVPDDEAKTNLVVIFCDDLGYADIGPFARARAIVERRLGIACRQQFRKIGQPVETAREERRVVARPLDGIGPFAWHCFALPWQRRRGKRAHLPSGPGFATSAATPNPRRLLR